MKVIITGTTISWNGLDITIRNTDSYSAFKRKVREDLNHLIPVTRIPVTYLLHT